jgi:glutamate N-acetyltransferase/amino-acid N-acetyltransferase
VAVTLPEGIAAAGLHCGIKAAKPDLAALVGARPLAWAGCFTRNAAAAAPVRWSRRLAGRQVRAVVVNSGNANACTGEHGEVAVAEVARAAADALACSPGEVLVSSTGVIGEPLPYSAIVDALPALFAALGDDPEPFARAIMTTDTHPKLAEARAGDALLVGVAKGAAMVAPNMATMLAFVCTDAGLPQAVLDRALRRSVDLSFNRICIDACESTNDSVYLLSTRAVAVDEGVFAQALEQLCADLAEQIVRDAEGGTRLVRLTIEGASDDDRALALARAVAASDLWRAAIHGADPNWGRVLSALGAADRGLNLGAVELDIAGVTLFAKGEPLPARAEAAAAMAHDFDVRVRTGQGPGAVTVLMTDLSPDYVTLNAFGTT